MLCDKCKNHKQITQDDFNKLPFRLSRQLDCKTILKNGNQCKCYSIEHATDKEKIKETIK